VYRAGAPGCKGSHANASAKVHECSWSTFAAWLATPVENTHLPERAPARAIECTPEHVGCPGAPCAHGACLVDGGWGLDECIGQELDEDGNELEPGRCPVELVDVLRAP
jgi:hypothetical protein